MSQDAVESVIGRLLTDEHFRTRLTSQLSETCRAEGYLLSDEELGMVGRINLSRLAQFAELLDGGIKRYSCGPPGNKQPHPHPHPHPNLHLEGEGTKSSKSAPLPAKG